MRDVFIRGSALLWSMFNLNSSCQLLQSLRHALRPAPPCRFSVQSALATAAIKLKGHARWINQESVLSAWEVWAMEWPAGLPNQATQLWSTIERVQSVLSRKSWEQA